MKNKIEENINLTKNEEQILFHTLGYDYEPRWNDNRGGYRNYFYTTGNCDDNDYILIQTLVEKGDMELVGNDSFGGKGKYFNVTQKGIDYVVDLWKKKKKENKPSRSKRRYQAYRDWCEWNNDASFREFLSWLKITEDKRLFLSEEVEYIEEFKKRWGI